MNPRAKAATDAAKIIELTEALVRSDTRRAEASERLAAIEIEVEETREQFADLKLRLLNAETELGRLNGYLARVHEDDVVRDGLVEIDDDRGKRMVPKRPPPLRAVRPNDGIVTGTGRDYSGAVIGDKKRTHWTDY